MRIEVIKRRDAFETDSAGFVERWSKEEAKQRKRILTARERIAEVRMPEETLTKAAQLCMALGTDGLRGELTLMRAARAVAALEHAKTTRSAFSSWRMKNRPSTRRNSLRSAKN